MSKENVALMNAISKWLEEDNEESASLAKIPRFCLPLKARDPWNLLSEYFPREESEVLALWKSPKTNNWIHYIYHASDLIKLRNESHPIYWVYLPEEYEREKEETDSESASVSGLSNASIGQAA